MKLKPKDIILLASLVLSITTILSVEFIFNDIPEIFNGGAKIGKILVNISLSYIAAYLFYIVIIIIPQKNERNQLQDHISHLIKRVLFYILCILQDTVNFNISQKNLKINDYDADSFRKATKNVFLDDELSRFRSGEDGHNIKVGQAVCRDVTRLKESINELLKYSRYLDSDLISYISKASRNHMNESWINRNKLGATYIGGRAHVPVRENVSCYSIYLYEFQQLYRKIEKIFISRYSNTEEVRRHVKNIKKLKQS